MGKQFNIRSEKAHALALDLSQRFNQPLSKIVEDALAAYDRAQPPRPTKNEVLWGPLLADAQRAVKEANSDFMIEDLYDAETGLPA